MIKEFIRKILNKEFEDLTPEELELITTNDDIFSLSKKDKKVLENIVKTGNIENSRDKITAILKVGLPSTMEILNNLDENSIVGGSVKFNFREEMLNNLNKMTNLQLCVFIDKVLKFSYDERLHFLRNKVYSLHEINGVISKSFNLSLVFEIFKLSKYKTFLAIDYNRIDEKLLIETFNNHAIRYLYILEAISEVVLNTEESMIFGTKINKLIRGQISDYINIIHKERRAVRKTGVKPIQSWTYTLCNLYDITVEDDSEDYELEDFDE